MQKGIIMANRDSEENRQFERLIAFINKEKEAGRLTQDQFNAISTATLAVLEVDVLERNYFLMGGSLSEKVARNCCQSLIAKYLEVSPESEQRIRVVELTNVTNSSRREH